TPHASARPSVARTNTRRLVVAPRAGARYPGRAGGTRGNGRGGHPPETPPTPAMKRLRLPALALLLLAAWPLLLRGQTNPATSFRSVVEKHFRRWDADGDGKLSPAEVNRLVTSRAVQGEQAAAVAAIHRAQRGKAYRDHPFTRAELASARDGTAAQRRDAPETSLRLNASFRGYRSHIAGTSRRLFSGDAPRLQGIHQGRVGNCFFLSAVGAAVHRSPRAVRRWFHARPDGSYDVA